MLKYRQDTIISGEIFIQAEVVATAMLRFTLSLVVLDACLHQDSNSAVASVLEFQPIVLGAPMHFLSRLV